MNKWCLLLGMTVPGIFTQSHAQQASWVYFNGDTCHLEKFTAQLEAQDEKLGVIGSSKWLFAACVLGEVSHIGSLPFVNRVEALRKYRVKPATVQQTQEDFSYGKSDWQLQMLGLDEYHKGGFTGKGVTIALFDAGFYRVDSLQAFDTLRKRNQILAEWDFFYNDTNVYVQDGHGMYVLSIAGGFWPDSIMGAAPDANFLLARTEIANREIHLEEYAWVKALEWADSIGVDIIHSSLGYSVFDTLEGDYVYADMDGRTTIITKATDIAASKGIFVTNSAGNEGAKPWHYITAPCDGRYVLCVGAVDSNRVHADFSSYGPSADGRVKPDVVAMGKGVAYVTKEGEVKTGSGTSFSGPLIAGMVACLKQAWPLATNDHLYRAIIQSADRYQNPDTAYGFGLPNVQKADSILAGFAGVSEYRANPLRLYPNPGDQYISFEGDLMVNPTIHFFDPTGKQVYSVLKADVHQVDVRGLQPGIYIVELMDSAGKASRFRWIKSGN